MPFKPQVVVFIDEYGAGIYSSSPDIQIIEIDVTQYRDEIPSRDDLDYIKKQMAKIVLPDALHAVGYWYDENESARTDIEGWELEERMRREAESLAEASDPQILLAKELLTEKGYKVTK